jgi:uncharacterized FlgJ-related protein
MYDQMIYEAALSEGFSPTAAKLIVAQARVESADYTSSVFAKNNNLFGMKFINQPLATKGSPAPKSEGDFYAKYRTPAESTKDLVGRLYKTTRKGVGFEQLKNVKDSTEFANKLKQRDYFGITAEQYGKALQSKLNKIALSEVVQKHKGKVFIGFLVLGVGIYLYLSNKN